MRTDAGNAGVRILGACILWLVAMTTVAATPPESLSPIATGDTSCAIRNDGRAMCWGSNQQAASVFSGQRIASFAGHTANICATTADGEVLCASRRIQPFAELGAGPWRSVSVNFDSICGLRPDGTLSCQSEQSGLAAAAPVDGHYRSVALGDTEACAIRDDGSLACWSASAQETIGPPPEGRFLQVSVGNAHACALRVDGRILCWGWNRYGQTVAPTDTDFIAVAVGAQFSCALRSNGFPVCWGRDWVGEISPPQEAFTHIDADYDHACGRRIDGTIQCWGGSYAFERDALIEPFEQIAIGGGEVCALDAAGMPICLAGIERMRPPDARYGTITLGGMGGCGIRRDGRTLCWGDAPGDPPDLAFRGLSLGEAHACGLKTDGAVVCWGDGGDGRTDAPGGVFVSLASGTRFTCGLREDGSVACWGAGEAASTVPTGTGFSELVASGRNVCVRRPDGTRDCWGEDAHWLTAFEGGLGDNLVIGDFFGCATILGGDVICDGDFARGAPTGSRGPVALPMASGGLLCVVEQTGMLQCSGTARHERRPESARIGFGDIALGARHGCSLGADGLVVCWGDDMLGQRRTPLRRARALSSEADHACAILANGTPACWGDDAHAGSTPPPGLALRAIDAGQWNACAVRVNGGIECWGWNVNGQSDPPPGLFRSVATGLNHSCGIRDDGTLTCWGYGADGQTDAPAGRFLSADVGERHSCALAVDGHLRCWGLGGEGQTAVPSGLFRAFASGAFHNCAIRVDATVACWGRNLDGQTVAPDEGRYVGVSAGTAHSCAIRDDGGRMCWGRDNEGQAPFAWLSPDTLPSANIGQAYAATFRLRLLGGTAAVGVRYRLIAGALPDGLSLDSASGVLSGVPTVSGVFGITIEARDDGGASDARRLLLSVVPTPDTTAPGIRGELAGPVGDGGWYRGDVRVRWHVTDAESELLALDGCDERLVVEDSADAVFVCTASSSGGTASATLRFRRDATPPTLSATMPPDIVLVNAAHDFRLTASDAMSGVSGSGCTPLDATVVGIRTVSCFATDHAGNTTTRSATVRVVARLPRTGGPQQQVPRDPPSALRKPPEPAKPRHGRLRGRAIGGSGK